MQSAPATKVYAVITGDIVGSTKLTPDEMAKVRTIIAEAVLYFLRHRNADGRPAEFFQGDSWQVLLGDPAEALTLTLLIAASLRAKAAVETRASIGIGTAEGLEVNTAISTGEAFTLSGRALEALPAAFRITGALPERIGQTARRWFPALLHMCSGLVQGWTRRQAEVMSLWLALPAPGDLAIASRLSITKQSVSDILISANRPALSEALGLFHHTTWQDLAAPQQEGKA